tara:strand:+ start:566 stop:898 length:333 start_codon:yes stop_codon:yes gene_type:complete
MNKYMRNVPLKAFCKKSPAKSIFGDKNRKSIVKDNKKSREEYMSKQKQPTGKNKVIVDSIVNTFTPKSGGEALGMVAGGGIISGLRKGGSKLYNMAKSFKNVKTVSKDKA